MNKIKENAVDEVLFLATYLQGMADASQNSKLDRAAYWLSRLGSNDKVCGQGYIGCPGGRECASSHR